MRLTLVLVLLMPGCAYLGSRARDLGDIVRVEGSIGTGLQANITTTEILHLGLGSSRRWAGGWAYGIPTAERRVEDHLPLSYLASLADPDTVSLHALRIGDDPQNLLHRCNLVSPFANSLGTIRKPSMQFWDIEIGVMALVIGVEAGFNPAEALDFVLGIFGIDIAADDDEADRESRRLWIPSGPEILSDW
ncbi:MAG TPA: hypothetical protein VFC90_07470 [Planctomycetota bacterium]|nr:hypothetical protein [Planctomycetota bacterium]